MPINQGQTLTMNHNLGGNPEDYAVELLFEDSDSGGLGINRVAFGGLEVDGTWLGAHWQELTANTIKVHRWADDNMVDRILVQVWLPSTTPDYDSDWRPIAQGKTLTFNHNLNVAADDLTVGLWFRSAARGINQFAYGGLSVDRPVPRD